MTEEQTPQGEVTYAYDASGRRTSMTVAGQSVVNYTWDNANRLTGISQGTSSVGLAYDNANRRSTLTLPNGVKVSYTYDSDSHITGLTYAMGSTQLGNLAYTYDADGRVRTKGGSLAAVTLPAAVTGNTFNAAKEMTAFNGTALSYDANGNLTGDGTNTYSWDARNHLISISGGATASFVYDAFGRRASKTVSGVTTEFLYDGLNPVQELNGNNPPSPTAELLTGLNIDEYFTRTASSMTSTLLADALGSTIGLVGSGGTIGTSYTYQPFGATTPGGAANTNPYQFTGRENDGTGLYFYRARYYSPTFQRFVSPDPIGFRGGDANLYSYVGDVPVQFIDPFGLIVFLAGGGRSSITGSGDETSAGAYHDTSSGLSGCFESYGAGAGANASAGAYVGLASDISSFMGYTHNYNISVGPVSITLMYNSGNQLVGGTFGLGVGSPIGATSTSNSTSPNSCSCAPRSETPYAEFHNADPEFRAPEAPEFRSGDPEFHNAP